MEGCLQFENALLGGYNLFGEQGDKLEYAD